MIQASFFQEEVGFRVLITGHSGFAPAGQDIVCAGASMLAFALAETLGQEKERGGLRFFSEKQESGRMELVLFPTMAGVERVLLLLKMAETGFRQLEEQYPEYVSLKHSI